MFGKKKRFDKDEVESIFGIALNIKERKGEEFTEDEIDNASKAGLNKDKIIKHAKNYKTKQQKEKNKTTEDMKKNPLKVNKQKRKKRKGALYLTYFIVWIVILGLLVAPFLIEENTDIQIEFLWLFIMIGTSIVGFISGMFIAELEGMIAGFFIGGIIGLGLYFLLQTSIGRITSLIVLGLISIILFFFVFKPRFKKMVKND